MSWIIGLISILVGFFIGTFVEQDRWIKCYKEKSIIRIGYKKYRVHLDGEQEYFNAKIGNHTRKFITREQLNKEIDEQLEILSNDNLDKKYEIKLKNNYGDYKL